MPEAMSPGPRFLAGDKKINSAKIVGPHFPRSGIAMTESNCHERKCMGMQMIAIQYHDEPRIQRTGTRIQIDIVLNDLVGCFLDDSVVHFDRQSRLRNCL